MNFLTSFRAQLKRQFYAAISSLSFLGAATGLQAQEAPTTVVEGTRVTLTATADGSPAPTFQWQKNGTPIAGATNAVLVLAAASASDAAKYTVVATNSAGSAVSPEAELIVQPAPTNPAVVPVITAQPANVVGTAGGTAVFSVTATGTPAPSYQWFKNGTAISGANAAGLTLSALTTSDVATYHVVVTNVAGSVTSAYVQLTLPEPTVVAVAPAITNQPANVVGAAGGTAVFSVTATGTPAPSYQWFKNSTAISGANTAGLTLSALTTSDVATYHVVVTNVAGSVTSAYVQLTLPEPTVVAVAPAITNQPADVVGAAGGTAVFSVTATGTPAPSYQWFKNGTAITGWNTAVLTLPALTTNDVATYKVVVTNQAGSVTSGNAQLTLQEPAVVAVAPAITNQPANVVGTVGGQATFSVSATGTPTPTFQWFKNGAVISGATNSVLNLTGLASGDVASYKVTATNSAGTATSNNVSLSLQQPTVTGTVPVFTTQPLSQTVSSGSTVKFTAAVEGSPTPTLQWRKNGTPISGATSSTLTLSSITSADAAGYTLVATNTAGTTISSEATLAVGSTPKFTKQPTSQKSPVGGSVKLSSSASGNPSPNYQWQKDGVSIPGATESELILTNVTTADSALYSVIASNPSGAAMSLKAEVVVGGSATASGAPVITAQPFSQSTVAKSSVTFQVSVTGTPTPTLQWRKDGLDIAGATAATLTIASASRADAGAYTVFARNDFGSTTSLPANLTVTTATGNGAVSNPGGGVVPADPGFDEKISRIVNLSVRASAGAGADSLIVGFVVSEGAQKPVLIRGIGPTLGQFGVANALQDPKISLYSGPVLASANDDWSANNNASEIRTRAAQLGAFALGESANDAALISILRSGTYTAQVTGQTTESGTALIEVYDGASRDGGRLINVSTRAQVGTGGDVPNIGFVIEGIQPKKVLIRAVGPTLGAFGVTGALSDPQLELFEGPSRLQHNDDWNGSSVLTQAFTKVGAFGLADALSKDAALLVTLEPGAYTAVVSGVNGSTGTVLVEVYEVQ